MESLKMKSTFKHNLLATIVTAVMLSVPYESVQASDLSLYQSNTPGAITLMLLIDISGSMASTDSGATGTRIERVKLASKTLLGKNAAGVYNIDDSKIIGLAHFSNKDSLTGLIDLPARSLGTIVGGTTQRQLMLDKIASYNTSDSTPTAHAFAEVGSYLLGTTTKGLATSGSGIGNVTGAGIRSGTGTVIDPYKYIAPTSISDQQVAGYDASRKLCNGQGLFIMSDGEPNNATDGEGSSKIMANALNQPTKFDCTAIAPISESGVSDGSSGWNCMANFARALYNGSNNPSGLQLRTAFAGLGSSFGTPADAANTIKTIAGTNLTYYKCTLLKKQDGKNACQLGERASITDSASGVSYSTGVGGFGNGGFFMVNTAEDIVAGVNQFINTLTPILPASNTGSPSIPVDSLNPFLQEPYAYYSQFQPDLSQLQGIWQGNLKKYKVVNNTYYGKTGGTVIKASDGKTLSTATTDYWNSSGTPDGGNALGGGAYSKLPVQPLARSLYTNRTFSGTAGTSGVEVVSNNNSLTQIPSAGGTGVGTAIDYAATQDPDRGYLLNLLGYVVPPVPVVTTAPSTAAILLTSPVPPILRQMGANIHSSPTLITTKGTLNADGTYSARNDYIMFGTTQGLLEVVDAKTGVEKFVFVPYEMIVNQKIGFLPVKSQSAATQLYAGIDSPWTAYSIFQPTASNSVAASILNVYGGLRMGGRSYYGLNFADSTRSSTGKYSGFNSIDTRAPKLLFKIDPVAGIDGTGVSNAAIGYMGQSWSKPVLAKIKWKGLSKLVMIVGGGYDTCFESPDFQLNVDYSTSTDPILKACSAKKVTQGAGVYIFDAATGGLLWWTGNATTGVADIKYSVVSAVKAIDRDSDGLVDALYFGDLGGQVFRIDIDNASSKASGADIVVPRIQRIANFNSGSNTKASPRFYEAPSWVFETDNQLPATTPILPSLFAAVSVASGDRSSPTNVFATGKGMDDGIYTIYDRDIFKTTLYDSSPAPVLVTKDITTSVMQNIASNPDLPTLQKSSGWYHTWTNGLTKSASKLGGSATIAKIKSVGPLYAVWNTLFLSTYDAAGEGTITACGAGVAGNSYQRNYCLPYGAYGTAGLGAGQCGTSKSPTIPMTILTGSGVPLGSGIIHVTVGGTDNSSGAVSEQSGTARSNMFGVINANPNFSQTDPNACTTNCPTTTTQCIGDDCDATKKDTKKKATTSDDNSLKVTLKRWYEKSANKNAKVTQ